MIGSKRLKFEYPHYTVICPQTGYTFNVRSLNVMEVNKLKGSLTVPAKTPSLINKSIWNAIEDKPEYIKDYDTFKRVITLRDREALMYGLYYSTFGDEQEFTVSCSKCEHEQLIKVSMSKIFSMSAYPYSEAMKNSYTVARITGDADYDPDIEKAIKRDKPPEGMPKEIAKLEYNIDDEDGDDGIIVGADKKIQYVDEKEEPKIETKPEVEKPVEEKEPSETILEKRLDIILPISKVHAIIKQPTLKDEEESLGKIAFAQKTQTDLINEIMVIERFEQYNPGDKVPSMVITEREDILYNYEALPPLDKLKIFNRFQEEFGQYGVDLKTQYACSECGDSNGLEVDIVVQFFRMVAKI